MKKILLSVLLLIGITNTALGIEVNKYLSGSWYNPAQDGHGFSVEVISEDVTIFYWYVYNPDGTPTFLLTVGINNGNETEGTTYYNYGMKWGEFNTADRTQLEWGTVKISFEDCNNATVEWDSDLSYGDTPYGQGSLPIQRLVSIDKMQCSNNPYAGLYQGNFYSDRYDRIIPGVALLADDGNAVGLSYDGVAIFGTYVANGNSFSASGFGFDLVSELGGSAVASGVIEPDHRLNFSYQVTGGDFGVGDLFATPALYRRGTSLEAIAGDYVGTNMVTGFQGSGTISADGSVSGSDSSGCTYNGQITVPDEQFNVLKLNIQVSACGIANGEYLGYGMVDDYEFLGDRARILLAGTNGSLAAIIELTP